MQTCRSPLFVVSLAASTLASTPLLNLNAQVKLAARTGSPLIGNFNALSSQPKQDILNFLRFL